MFCIIIISFPLKYGGLFPRTAFHGEAKLLGQLYGEGVALHEAWGTNDQIMPKGGEFHKNIFQYSEH